MLDLTQRISADTTPESLSPKAALLHPPVAQSPSGMGAITLLQMITGMWVTQSIYVAASLGIADLLKDGAKGVEDLAELTDCQVDYLYRVLRSLSSNGIFTEVAPQQFALTEIANYLRSDVPGSLRALALTISDDWQWNCFGGLLQTVKTGQSAMQRRYQVEDTFEYLTQVQPESGKIFDQAMVGWASSIHLAIIGSYDFSSIHTLVDIAGGHGTLMTEILKMYPQLKGIVFDLPNVAVGASERLISEGVANRCETVGGSFFETVPAGADAYMLSHILHDWGDEDCLKILRNIRQAMPDTGQLLIVEMLIPPGDTPHFGKLLDVTMLSIFSGGRERTEDEYAQLLLQAGFRVQRTVPTSGLVSVIEAVPALLGS